MLRVPLATQIPWHLACVWLVCRVCPCLLPHSHNKLQGLPASITKLPKLSTLIASYNPGITAMPAKLSALTGLLDLQMSHCGLKAVPQALAAAPKLKALQLEGNPFDDKKLPKVILSMTGRTA